MRVRVLTLLTLAVLAAPPAAAQVPGEWSCRETHGGLTRSFDLVVHPDGGYVVHGVESGALGADAFFGFGSWQIRGDRFTARGSHGGTALHGVETFTFSARLTPEGVMVAEDPGARPLCRRRE